MLVKDDRLSFAFRKVGLVLFSFSSALGVCCKSYEEIARLAHCSTRTAQEAVLRLAELGYISYTTQKRFCNAIHAVAYGKNVYSVNLNVLKGGYTLVSREVFKYDLTASAFILYIAVLTAAGNRKRAFPSITKLQKMTGAARSTVCAGLRLLKRLPLLFVQLCVKKNGAYAANSYHLVNESSRVIVPRQAANEATSAGVRPSVRFYSSIKRAVCKAVEHLFLWLRRLENCQLKLGT